MREGEQASLVQSEREQEIQTVKEGKEYVYGHKINKIKGVP